MSAQAQEPEIGSVRKTPGVFGTTSYLYCGAGVERHDTPTVMDGLVVRYTFGTSSEISASRNAICIHGVEVHGSEGLDRLNTILEWAFKQHEHIAQCESHGLWAKVTAIPQAQLGWIQPDEPKSHNAHLGAVSE